jgi:carboxyl-terminal processing protease
MKKRKEEFMEEEKKQNGFWKGFFCATLIFILIIGVGAGMFAGISGMNREETSAENRGMVTADIAVQSKLRLLESYIRRLYLDEIDDETLEDYLYYGLVAGLRDPYAA